MDRIPRSASCHSGRFHDRIATRSPNPMPSEERPAAVSAMARPYVAHVVARHALRSSRARSATRSPAPDDALREHVQNRRVRWPEPGSADKLRAGSRAHHLLLGDRAPAGRQRDNSPPPSLHLSEPRRHGQRTRMRRPDEHLRRTPLRDEGGGPLWIRRPGRRGRSKPRAEVQTPTSSLSSTLPFTCAGAAKVLFFGVLKAWTNPAMDSSASSTATM